MSDSHLAPAMAPLVEAAERVLTLTQKESVSEADVVVSAATEFEVKVADGEIITLTQATSKGLGLRVFIDGRLGFCTTSELTPDSLTRVVARAAAMARVTTPDEHNGLAPVTAGRIVADEALGLFDPKILELSVAQKIQWAHDLETAARSVDPRIRKFRDSGVSTEVTSSVLATTTGAEREMQHTAIALWCNPLAESNGERQTEVWYDTRTHLADLESVESVGRTAAHRALRMLGARPVKTARVPVIFEPQMAAGLCADLVAALNGDLVYKKASFLTDRLDTVIAAGPLSVIDDPLLPRGVASTPFDDEGLPTYQKALIDHGRLTTFLYDSYTARKAGAQPTASGQRGWGSPPRAGVFNLLVSPGDDDPAEILSSVDRAFWMTRGLGHGLNPVTGEYSRGANGLWIEKGEVVHPVQEVTIAGDYLEMLQSIDRVGTDFQLRGAAGAPTLRVAEMIVGGS